MKVIERISPTLRIVKHLATYYKKPYVVQRKINHAWWNIPNVMETRAFREKVDAMAFAQEHLNKN